MHLVLPIAPCTTPPLPDELHATVRHRAQRCLTTADAPLATARLPSPNERSANVRSCGRAVKQPSAIGRSDSSLQRTSSMLRTPLPNERSANVRPCGRAPGNRPPASEATLPDYAALRYTLIINYPPTPIHFPSKYSPPSLLPNFFSSIIRKS